MQVLDTKLKQLPTWELATDLGELEMGGAPESLGPLLGFKLQGEDRGDMYKDRGYLYGRIKILCEEDYEPEPVLTQGMEDAISIISNLSSPCLKCDFHTPNSPNSCC